ncbi:MAG: glycosyltransferase family 4 protein [Chloroflexota bacterium]
MPAPDSLDICIVSGTFHPDSGGPPTYLRTLGAELLRRSHRVGLITYGSHRADPEQSYHYPFPVTRVRRDQPVPLRLAQLTREILRQGRRADLLFVSDYGLPAITANALLRKPLVIKIVGDFAWEYAVRHGLIDRSLTIDEFQGLEAGGKVRLLKQMQSRYCRAATRVITPGRYLGRIVEGWGVPAERIRVVSNAVAAGDPPDGLRREALLAEAGLPSDARVVLVVARLTAWKGVDTVIRAVGLAMRAEPRIRLVVAGDGPEGDRLERLAMEIIPGAAVFLGEVERSVVQSWMGVSAALALCSAYEGLSHVILEGMAAGVPVVASAVGGNVELVRDGETGLLVPYGDVDATTDALRRLLGETELRCRCVAGGRAEVAGRTVDRMVDGAVDVFREAIAAS